MHEIDTCLFIGGLRDGTIHDVPSTHERLVMPKPFRLSLTAPGRGQSVRQVEQEIYLRSTWMAEGYVTFVFYRHENLTYADAIGMVLKRYAQR